MSYEFSLSTERTSLIGTETFRDHFVNSLKLSIEFKFYQAMSISMVFVGLKNN